MKAQWERAKERRHANPEPYRAKDRAWYEKHRDRLRTKRLDLKARTWRPDDWKTKSVDWKIIGTLLLTHPDISNQQLGFYLDKAKIGNRANGKSWQEALSTTDSNAASQLVKRVRNWVKQSGRTRTPTG